MSPNTSDIAAQEMERYGRDVPCRSHRMNVTLGRQQVIEIARLEMSLLLLDQVSQAIGGLSVHAAIDALMLFSGVDSHQSPGQMIVDRRARASR
jgi:hypothetical protein